LAAIAQRFFVDKRKTASMDLDDPLTPLGVIIGFRHSE
jgi:hypothetical protein